MTSAVVSIETHSLGSIRRRIIAGYERMVKGGNDWIEGSLEMAAALREGRDKMPANLAFKDWLIESELTFISYHDRAALINLAGDIELARIVLKETARRSYRHIWQEYKDRFVQMGKTPAKHKRRRNSMVRADIFRRMKLGDKLVDDIKGTSLDSAPEIDELVILNRGAPEGEHTDIVKRLVKDAVDGKDVSAIAAGKRVLGDATAKEKGHRNLLTAWRKRMVAAWELAAVDERHSLISYLFPEDAARNALMEFLMDERKDHV